MWYEPILAYALEAIVTLVIALIALAVAYGTRYINKLSERLQEQSNNELVDHSIARLERLVVVAVTAAEQRVASDLRQAVKDGKVERTELLAVADAVKADVLNALGEETVWLLEETFGDVNKLIENYIESAVHNLKK